MNIKYVNTAYVDVEQETLEELQDELTNWAEGDECVCVTVDMIKEYLELEDYIDKEGYSDKLGKFLKSLLAKLDKGVVDVVFSLD